MMNRLIVFPFSVIPAPALLGGDKLLPESSLFLDARSSPV